MGRELPLPSLVPEPIVSLLSYNKYFLLWIVFLTKFWSRVFVVNNSIYLSNKIRSQETKSQCSGYTMKTTENHGGCVPELVAGLLGAVNAATEIVKSLLFLSRGIGHSVHNTLIKSLCFYSEMVMNHPGNN